MTAVRNRVGCTCHRRDAQNTTVPNCIQTPNATSTRTKSSRDRRNNAPNRSRTLKKECHADAVNPALDSSTAMQLAANEKKKTNKQKRKEKKWGSQISRISVRCASSS